MQGEGHMRDRFWRWVVLRGSQHGYGLKSVVPGVPEARGRKIEKMMRRYAAVTDTALRAAADLWRALMQVQDRARSSADEDDTPCVMARRTG